MSIGVDLGRGGTCLRSRSGTRGWVTNSGQILRLAIYPTTTDIIKGMSGSYVDRGRVGGGDLPEEPQWDQGLGYQQWADPTAGDIPYDNGYYQGYVWAYVDMGRVGGGGGGEGGGDLPEEPQWDQGLGYQQWADPMAGDIPYDNGYYQGYVWVLH